MGIESITPDMVDCWRANYGLDARSPADAARYWVDTCAGMAPAGAVAALGLLLQERERWVTAAAAALEVLDDLPAWSNAAHACKLLRDALGPNVEAHRPEPAR